MTLKPFSDEEIERAIGIAEKHGQLQLVDGAEKYDIAAMLRQLLSRCRAAEATAEKRGCL